MTPVFQQYTGEIYREFGYLATWLPNNRLKLGDVGILKGDRFELLTTLDDLGVAWEARDLGGEADYQYLSKEGAEVSFHGRGSAAVPGDPAPIDGIAEVSFSFSRANAVAFIASGCVTTLISNLQALGDEILRLRQDGRWNSEAMVVAELVTAKASTIIISATENARLDLAVDTRLGSAGLAAAAGALRVSRSSGVATQIVAAQDLTPLFRAGGVRRRFARPAAFQLHSSMEAEGTGDAEYFSSDVRYDHLYE